MRKENRTYYFSVEGETEQWYLEWLQRMINADPTARYTVKLDSKIQKDPLARAKQLTIVGKTEVTHIFDYESEEPGHIQQFKTTLDRMKAAQNSGKDIKYQLGYSNFTFELWIIVHKTDCNGVLTHRRQYLTPLNRAYDQQFESLDQYKHEDNFKRILSQLTLDNVRNAIQRSKAIMQRNQEAGYILQQYKRYKYYKENPSLSIWESIEKILRECELL
ncbi:RloB domain-containing protein [Clostridium sp. WB02_MRS01]|uniref:RloB domain-containing protein n=1 Tax=Clostridium sp. WB02_MRS01 TaxID=2605777 RepID=UPI0012B26648|nr:RloB domain-containing protein [Clostridium sp. WB02_MRS01]MSS10360.1 RloB domain-containing protein [Clostridium sp. WB02_MRS01]